MKFIIEKCVIMSNLYDPLGTAESEHWSSFFFFIFSQNILKEEMAETYKWQWQWKGGGNS